MKMNLKRYIRNELAGIFDGAAVAQRPTMSVDEKTLLHITNGFGQHPNFEPSSSSAPENRL